MNNIDTVIGIINSYFDITEYFIKNIESWLK